MAPFLSNEKKLREERRHRAIVVVGIVDEVRVELDLVIVEVEDRRVVEPTIGIRIIITFVHPYSPSIEIYPPLIIGLYSLYFVFYLAVTSKASALDKSKQCLLKITLS